MGNKFIFKIKTHNFNTRLRTIHLALVHGDRSVDVGELYLIDDNEGKHATVQ